jgi:hypothetical protein
MTDIMQDNRKVEVAARINVQADRIKTVQLQLNVLRNQGILVDLSKWNGHTSGAGYYWSRCEVFRTEMCARNLVFGAPAEV